MSAPRRLPHRHPRPGRPPDRYAGAFWRSELVGLIAEVEDSLRITLDQEGEGIVIGIPCGSNPVTCPGRRGRSRRSSAALGNGMPPPARACGRRCARAAFSRRAWGDCLIIVLPMERVILPCKPAAAGCARATCGSWCAAWPARPGSARGSSCRRTACAIRRSPSPWTPAPRCATCRTTPATKIPAPPRRYDHSRDSLDRNAAYTVAAYLA